MHHVPVAPHPRREAAEVGECRIGVGIVREPHDVAIDPVRVGPVALDRDDGEAELVDQPARDAGPLAVELVSAVRGLADEHELLVADEIEQRVVIVAVTMDPMRGVRDRMACLVGSRALAHRSFLSSAAVGMARSLDDPKGRRISRAVSAGRSHPETSAPKRTFSNAVSPGNRLYVWNTKLTVSRRYLNSSLRDA